VLGRRVESGLSVMRGEGREAGWRIAAEWVRGRDGMTGRSSRIRVVEAVESVAREGKRVGNRKQ
jgi:hypothetical protein